MAPPSKHIPEYLSHKDESACTYRKNLTSLGTSLIKT